MKFNKIKSTRGVSIADIVIAIMVLAIFVGTIGTLISKVVRNNNLIYLNAIATDYTIKISEYIDKIAYSEVNEELKDSVIEKFDILEQFTPNITIENYSDLEEGKEDIIKIVTITMDYSYLGEDLSYQIKKIKVKEK